MAEQAERDERTEEATPRRREEARDQGQVAMSTEFVAAGMLAVAVGCMVIGGGMMARSMGMVVDGSLSGLGGLGTTQLSLPQTSQLIEGASRGVLPAFCLLVLPALAIGVLLGYGQVGFRLTPKAVSLDGNKLNPVKGLQRLFSARAVVRTSLAFAKISLIALVVSLIAWLQIPRISSFAGADLGPVLRGLGHVLLRCVAGALVTAIVLAVLDLAFQRFQLSRDLRMTRKEVKDEHKNLEGDPHVKARIRGLQREMASRRMMDEVPKASVVVTNPTHYAVALRYEREGENAGAPACVAKGVDHVAQRIKQVAREHEIVCFEDVPLARALHARVEVGQEIPEEFFEAVASVLAYVYRVRGEVAAR